MMRTIQLTVACLVTLLATAEQVQAGVIIDFEDLGVSIGTQINTPNGVGIVTNGFNYTPGPINDAPFNQLYISNQQTFWSSNGSTIGGTNDDVVLTKVGGGVFSLVQFDFAGFILDKEIPFTVLGTRGDSTTIINSFAPDGLADGPGGVDDFQTFAVTGDWTNLVSVSWAHYGPGTVQGLFALDNIKISDDVAAVPEPASLAIFGLGALGLIGGGIRRRKQKA